MFLLTAFAVDVSVPWWVGDDVWWDEHTVSGADDGFWIWIVDVVNFYLWFFIGLVAMVALIYGWYLLISSRWSEEELKKANKLITYWLIWIFVALFSYLIIRLIVNIL